MRSAYERVAEKLTRMTNGCLEFQGCRGIGHDTYGRISGGHRGQPPLRAHRVVWEHHNGMIPSGMVVRHKCDNPPCCDINHLEIGTQSENAADVDKRNRRNPKSLLNLRPGAPGFHGAGPTSLKDKSNGTRR